MEETAMASSRVSDHKRIAAGILGAVMLFIMLFSAYYISAQANHGCIGEDCPICACIAQCESTLRQIGTGMALQIAFVLSAAILLASCCLCASVIREETPVTRKVRLNN